MDIAYLDNSATTRVCPQAAEKALEMMTSCFGNPSSLHSLGAAAELFLCPRIVHFVRGFC